MFSHEIRLVGTYCLLLLLLTVAVFYSETAHISNSSTLYCYRNDLTMHVTWLKQVVSIFLCGNIKGDFVYFPYFVLNFLISGWSDLIQSQVRNINHNRCDFLFISHTRNGRSSRVHCPVGYYIPHRNVWQMY